MYKKYLISFLLILLFYLNVLSAHDNNQERQLFCHLRQLILAEQYLQFEKLKKQLLNYPLYPYLSYFKLKQQLAYHNFFVIDKFLTMYKNMPLSDKLRTECLSEAIKQKDWKTFIHFYKPTQAPTLQCYYLNALLATQHQKFAYSIIPKLWLGLKSPPPICRRVFLQWKQSGEMSEKLIWQKISNAFKNHDVIVIQHLEQQLNEKQKKRLKFWYQIYQHPLLVKYSEKFSLSNPLDRKIIMTGIDRLAEKNLQQFAKLWPNLSKTYHLNENEKQYVLKRLFVLLARKADLKASIWLRQIKASDKDEDSVLRKWRVRHALLKKDWNEVFKWINQLTPEEQKFPCWRYWRARTLEKNKQFEEACLIYKDLATKVNYYGVLSSQRLKKQYLPLALHISVNSAELLENKAIQRVKELRLLGFITDARRELLWALPHLSLTERQAAARLANQWQWYDLAIIIAARAEMYNDIKLRFPKAYATLVLVTAKNLHINPAWIWAIMRQESAFMWNVKSGAGAFGLMQIMPNTAKILARKFNMPTINLLDPKQNICLGSTYLKCLLKSFHGSAFLATAAYNVGPGRIKHYQKLYQKLPQDIWVEILPWKETRDYLKSVYLGRNIYNRLL